MSQKGNKKNLLFKNSCDTKRIISFYLWLIILAKNNKDLDFVCCHVCHTKYIYYIVFINYILFKILWSFLKTKKERNWICYTKYYSGTWKLWIRAQITIWKFLCIRRWSLLWILYSYSSAFGNKKVWSLLFLNLNVLNWLLRYFVTNFKKILGKLDWTRLKFFHRVVRKKPSEILFPT